MVTVMDIMVVVLKFYLAVTPSPNPAFLHSLKYLACEEGCPSGMENTQLRTEIVRDWKLEEARLAKEHNKWILN